ncbi:P0 protein [Cowpea polerovirus 2]|uniref:p0 protein n=1 Tax=Cowpea polerovirus 2 TaxID=1913125 RepID=A0A1U9RYH6_9VIRU|nr:P0 protein [Cowpea polerovirus 2]AQV03234.1 P0 protein [Cowpea polerovirus 2]
MNFGNFLINEQGSCVTSLKRLSPRAVEYFSVLAVVCQTFLTNDYPSSDHEFILRCFVFLLPFLLRGPKNIGVRKPGDKPGLVRAKQFYAARFAARLGVYTPSLSGVQRTVSLRLSNLEFTRNRRKTTAILQRHHARSVGARIERRKDVLFGGERYFKQFVQTYCRFLDHEYGRDLSKPLLVSDLRVVLAAAHDYSLRVAFRHQEFHARACRCLALYLISSLGEDSALVFWVNANLPRSHILFHSEVVLAETLLGQELQKL